MGVGTLGAVVPGSCELPNVATGSLALVLCKSSQRPSHPPSCRALLTRTIFSLFKDYCNHNYQLLLQMLQIKEVSPGR